MPPLIKLGYLSYYSFFLISLWVNYRNSFCFILTLGEFLIFLTFMRLCLMAAMMGIDSCLVLHVARDLL